MTLIIPLTSETEAVLRERAARAGKDPVDFAREVLEETLAVSDVRDVEEPNDARAGRVANFLDWVASHQPVGHFVDDSRESIYEGRGE